MKEAMLIFLICLVPFIMGWLFGSIIGQTMGYKEGQVDYAMGRISYTLQTNANNEVSWERKHINEPR